MSEEVLQISKSNVRKAYEEGDKTMKKFLSTMFGEEFFKPKAITDRIKSFEDVLAATGEIPDNVRILLDYNGADQDLLGARAMLKLTLIAKALNEGWTPDWSNTNERKWYPWFQFDPSSAGFGFSGSVYDFVLTGTSVGSRLCFKSEALAKYAGTQFIDIYNQFLITNK